MKTLTESEKRGRNVTQFTFMVFVALVLSFFAICYGGLRDDWVLAGIGIMAFGVIFIDIKKAASYYKSEKK